MKRKIVVLKASKVAAMADDLGPTTQEAIKRGLYEAALFGRTAIIKTSATTKPRPYATGTYEAAWRVMKSKDGALVGNPTLQSFFVERGRRPGKRPPLDPIIEWLKIKGIVVDGEDSEKAQKAVAYAIAKKIGDDGTPARKVVERSLPATEKFAKYAVQREIDAMKPPTG